MNHRWTEQLGPWDGGDSSCDAAKETSELEMQRRALSKMNPREQNTGGEGSISEAGRWPPVLIQDCPGSRPYHPPSTPPPGTLLEHQNRCPGIKTGRKEGFADPEAGRPKLGEPSSQGPPQPCPTHVHTHFTHTHTTPTCATHMPVHTHTCHTHPSCVGNGRPPGKVRETLPLDQCPEPLTSSRHG